MTFPKIRNIEDLIKKIKSYFIWSFAILFEFRKLHVFQNCILGPRKMFILSGLILEAGENLFRDFWSPFSISFYFFLLCRII